MKAVVALILLGTQALLAPAALGDGMPDKGCTGLVISSDDQTAVRAGPVFSARKILDITLRMAFPASLKPEPGFALRVVLTTPNGFRYQEQDVPVVAQGSRETDRPMSGYLFPVMTRPLVPSTDGKGDPAQIVELKIPVGGTAMTENGLYGTWSVDVHMGESRPCSGKFHLTP